MEPDQIDAENVRSLSVHAGYQIVRKRIEKAVLQKTEALLIAKSWEETRHLQGYIEALKLALEMPVMISAEIRKRTQR